MSISVMAGGRARHSVRADGGQGIARPTRFWLAIFAGLVFLLMATVGAVVGAESPDANAMLQSWLNAQTNIHTWSADFVQTRTLKALTQPLTESGHVWFGAPNRFRW